MQPSEHYEHLARSLTLDQAYARAYGDLRRLLLSACENLPDLIASDVITAAVNAVAGRLERELTELMYSPELAVKLARPE